MGLGIQETIIIRLVLQLFSKLAFYLDMLCPF